MKTPIRGMLGLAALAFLIAPAPSQAQQAGAAPAREARLAERPASALLDRATEGLALSADQQATLSGLAAQYGTVDAADSWRLAADVHRVLTAEQVASLRTVQGERREAAVRQMRGQAREGARQGRAAGAQGRAERRAPTPEQQARMAEARARAEAVQQARAEALGLTEAQQEAARARMAEARAAQAANRMAIQGTVLTAEQQGVMAVHRAMMGMPARAEGTPRPVRSARPRR